jgi:hypothetical protein
MLKRAHVRYSALPPLHFRVQARGRELWAWNRDHALEILQCLRNRNVGLRRKPLERFYLRKEWLRYREDFSIAIERRLRGQP